MIRRDVQINNQYPRLVFSEESIEIFFDVLDSLTEYSIGKGELSIAFVNDSTIAQIHDEFLNDPCTTDVITFPANPQFDLAGEICVSVDHAISLSGHLKTSFAKELTLYLVHGWLHLAGLNDLTAPQSIAMRAAEKQVMNVLEKAGSIPDFRLL